MDAKVGHAAVGALADAVKELGKRAGARADAANETSRSPEGACAERHGDSTVSVDINIGDPSGARAALAVQLTHKSAVAGDDRATVSIFVTLNDPCVESDVRRVVEFLSEFLSEALREALREARASHVPPCLSVDVVEYRGERAIRIRLELASIDPTDVGGLLGGLGLDGLHGVEVAARVSFGASLRQIVLAEAALKELLNVRVQGTLVVPSGTKDAARAALRDLPPEQLPGFAGVAAIALSLKRASVAMEFGDVYQALSELAPSAARAVWLHEALEAPPRELHRLLSAYVAMRYNGTGEQAARLRDAYPVLRSAFKGLSGVELAVGEGAFELTLTGFDVFALMPSVDEIADIDELGRSRDDARAAQQSHEFVAQVPAIRATLSRRSSISPR
jgi:hypothetical protein